MSDFRLRTSTALADPSLRTAIARATDRFAANRAAVEDPVNLDELRHAARSVRNRIITTLPEVLATFADRFEANGGTVHWARDAAEANQIITGVAAAAGGIVVKSKSMVTEEIGLNDALEARGIEVVETDLGEWIIQLAGERPSHIIGPAIHMSRDRIASLFNRHSESPVGDDPVDLCAFARRSLREKFLTAGVGITGCNFGVAETGTVVLVTNEGNGRMVTTVPPVHIVVMGMERVVETWDQLDLMMSLLPRAATGQAITVYTSHTTGPRREGETDGPDDVHLVVVDNGRSDIIGSEYQEILHCIRCGACLNVCPVYRQIGGHAYGSVYSGPVGAVLAPLLDPGSGTADLPEGSTLCGACEQACPVDIPLQDLLLRLRRRGASSHSVESAAWKAWAAAWKRPAAYRASLAAIRHGVGRVPDAVLPSAWTAQRSGPKARGRFDLRRRLERGEI